MVDQSKLEMNVFNPEFVSEQINTGLKAQKLLDNEIESTKNRLDKLLRTRSKLKLRLKMVAEYQSILTAL